MSTPSPSSDVSLRKISSKTVRKICDLKVSDAQAKFVAPNAVSIAEAYYCKSAWFRAIYAGETPVGFVMLNIKPKRGTFYLWRFMVDAKYQKMNYGRKALQLVIGFVRKRYRAKAMTLSVVRAEGSADAFYRKFGFDFTGKIDDGEHVMKLIL